MDLRRLLQRGKYQSEPYGGERGAKLEGPTAGSRYQGGPGK